MQVLKRRRKKATNEIERVEMRLHIRKVTSREDSYTAVIIRVNGPIILERLLYPTIKRLAGKIRIYPYGILRIYGKHVIPSP